MKTLLALVFWLVASLLAFLGCWLLSGCSSESVTNYYADDAGSTGGSESTGGKSSVGGLQSAGGSIVGTSTVPATESCPCPVNAQCEPVSSSCAQSDRAPGDYGKVTCVQSLTRCTQTGFRAYCFEC